LVPLFGVSGFLGGLSEKFRYSKGKIDLSIPDEYEVKVLQIKGYVIFL
jgi:hypothetical protein